MLMNKVVDGKEITMGTLIFQVDASATRLSSEVTRGELHALWTFNRSGSEMTGTLKRLPDGAVIRHNQLEKKDR